MVETFLEACCNWVCDEYSLDVRYIAEVRGQDKQILAASVALNSVPATQDNSLRLVHPTMIAGQVQLESVDKESLMTVLRDAAEGVLRVHGMSLVLPREGEYRWQAGVPFGGGWFLPLRLQVFGSEPVDVGERIALGR